MCKTLKSNFFSLHTIVVLGLMCLLGSVVAKGQSRRVVVVDSLSHTPLPNASVFNSKGVFVGNTSMKGTIPSVSGSDYPLIVRYMGFYEHEIPSAGCDTVYMQENITQLDEVVVETKEKKMLHILAYVREYSTLSTYTDTVTMFREKMVDFMLPPDAKVKYKGWKAPRPLSSKSYYRFTNSLGLDSVSDKSNYHFSWSDWIGLPSPVLLPQNMSNTDNVADTVAGKYGTKELWRKSGDKLTVDVDVLADTSSRRWVPNISAFFNDDSVEFERFKLRYAYDNVAAGEVGPLDLDGFSFSIESTGRGHGMFKFNRYYESFYVTTYTEVYILNKEFISVKDAKKWEKNLPQASELGVYVAPNAPDLQPSTLQLIERVESIDHENLRLEMIAGLEYTGKERQRKNFGEEVFTRIKGWVGVDKIIGRRKNNQQWREFRHNQRRINSQSPQEE